MKLNVAVEACEALAGRPAEPGEIYELRVVLYPVSRYFAAGSRIQVEVTSSNFPQFARNLNTGASSDTTTAMRRTTTRIYHDAERPSRIVLPLVPARGGHGPGGCGLVEGD